MIGQDTPLLFTPQAPEAFNLRAVLLCRAITRISSVIVLAIGCIGLLGWLFNIDVLKGSFSDGILMKANTAVCLIMSGVAVLLLSDEQALSGRRRTIGRVLGAVMLLVGGLTLCEHVFGWELHIDQLLFREPPGARATASPGRIGPPASSSFLLAGLALLLLDVKTRRGGAPAQYLALLVGLIALLPLIGYAYSIKPLYSISNYTGIAAHTALALGALAVALLAARPRAGLMAVVTADDAGGMMARRLLIPAVLIPFFLGWLRTLAERANLVDTAFGRMLLILSLIVSFTAIVWLNARDMGFLSRERTLALAAKEQAEQASRESSQRLRLAVDAAHLGHWEYHAESGACWFSAEMASMLGLPPLETRETLDTWTQRVHPDDVRALASLAQAHLEGRDEYETEYRIQLDGAVRWLSSRGRVIRDGAAGGARVVGVVADVTDRKQAEEALKTAKASAEAASTAKDQFLAVLSHELRTPLTPVLTTVQMMEIDPALSSENRELATMVRRNVELEAKLIDDLLDLTRISRGKLELHLTEVDLHDKIRHICQICEGDIRAKDLRLDVHLDALRCEVLADAPRLQQVLWNLVKNAVKFTPAGGSISVRTANNSDRQIELRVIDSGIGIEPDVLPRIFNAFEQGGSQTTRQFGGLGLGLAISKALTDLQNGTLTAHSEGPGRGSTFTLTLPLAASHAATDRSTDPIAGAKSGPSCRILLVEDHADTLRATQRLLQSFGFDVIGASSVRSALQAVQLHRFDLVISDLGLPDGSGHDLIRQILQQQPVKCIALSGFGMAEDIQRSEDAGFAAHLTKPVNLTQLRATVIRVLNGELVQPG